MPHDQGWSIEASLASFSSDIREVTSQPAGRRASPEGLQKLERELHRRAHRLCDVVMATIVQMLLWHRHFWRRARQRFRDETPGRWKSKGRRRCHVQFLGGSRFSFEAGYLVDEQGEGWQGRQGWFPEMAALGIDPEAKASPALADEVMRQMAVSDSLEEAQCRLNRRGYEVSESRIYRIWQKLSGRLLEDRDAWLEAPGEYDGPIDPAAWDGAHVVICLDGGRVRIRQDRDERTETGYCRFDGDWKEPKLLTIYAVDEQGDRRKEMAPIIDGTMRDADGIYEMLGGYLDAIEVGRASQVTVVADGAPWIWNRIDGLLDGKGVPDRNRRKIVDIWHARERLWEIVEMPDIEGWDEQCERIWFERCRKALEEGNIERLGERVAEIDELADREDILEEMTYFRERADKMQYRKARQQGRPIASGAVESAIRRVVGLRMKGCGTFWKRPGAQRMLLIRSWLKAGRLEELWHFSMQRHARGWSHDDALQLTRTAHAESAA